MSGLDCIDDQATVWFDQGVVALNSTPPQLLEAVRLFSRALYLCPHSGVLYAHRGEAFLRLTDLQAAMRNFRRAHALEPSDASIQARLGQMHYIQGRLALDASDVPAAVRSFSDAIRLQPHNSDFWIARIKAWIKGRQYGRALQELNRFISEDADAALLLPRAEEEKTAPSNPAGAESNLDDSDLPVAAVPAAAAEEDDAPLLESALHTARSHAAPPPSLLTAAGSSSGLSHQRVLQALLLRSKILLLLSRFDLALRDVGWAHTLSQSTAATGGNSEVRLLLESLAMKGEQMYLEAVSCVLAGRTSQAVDALTRALDLSPRNVKFLSLRAKLYREQDALDHSLTDLKVALGWHVADRRARAERAREQQASQAQTGSSQPSAAATFMTASADIDDDEQKDDEQIVLEKSLALTFNALGVKYIQEGQFSHGISCLSKAIELDSTLSAFFCNRGDCFLALDDPMQALSDFQRGRQLDPANIAVRGKIGQIHARDGREWFNRTEYENAESDFSRALAADPSCASHFLYRARTRHVLRKYELSYRDAEQAVALHPADPEARAFLLQLRQSLLRPADLARAPPLPPLPPVEQPWIRSGLRTTHLQERLSAAQDRRYRIGAPQEAGGNGSSVLAMVYGASQPTTVIRQKQGRVRR